MITILSIAAIVVSIIAMIMLCKPAADKSTDVQYVVYLGTNDKDTNKPVFSHEEANEKAEEILLEQFGGYTIQEADGGWIARS